MPHLNTAAKEEITEDLVAGISQYQIAAAQGVSQPTISKFKKTIQDIIDTYQYKLIAGAADKSVDNTINTISKAHAVLSDPNTTPKDIDDCKTLLYLSDKKEERVLKGLGIVDSHTGSPVINNWITGDITIHNTVDPNVQAALGGHLAGILSDDNVTDADYTEDMSNIEQDS